MAPMLALTSARCVEFALRILLLAAYGVGHCPSSFWPELPPNSSNAI
jgi:hypothetical protein